MHSDDIIRERAARALAAAVRQVWPDAELDALGHDDGDELHADFDLAHRISRDDLPRIERAMRAILAEYPGACGAFELLDVAGVHARDDAHAPMRQRVHAVAFARSEDLDAWRERRAEAARRDHRKLGRALDLFSVDEAIGPGLVLWHPRGALVKKIMEDWWRSEHLARGYGFVSSPHVGKSDLWRTSGHLDFYRDAMFAPMEMEGADYHLKPMNCPFHMMVYRNKRRSHRELPMRLAELGTVYRYERSGVLHGLLRVRGFTQDDAHVFCAPEQVEDEIVAAVSFALDLLRAFGFADFGVTISTRPEKFVGDAAEWDDAIGALERSASRLGLEAAIDEGGGAFYGPKIDVHIRDAIGRLWQCSTVQFDFNLPARFDLSYVGPDNVARRPVVVHRALFGSLERFFAVMLEHHAGSLPAWLAPEQVRVVAVTDRSQAYAEEIAAVARAAGARAEADPSSERLGAKIRSADAMRVPIVLVVGDAEVERREVAARVGGEKVGAVPIDELATWLASRIAPPS